MKYFTFWVVLLFFAQHSSLLGQSNYRLRSAEQMALNIRNSARTGSLGTLSNPASLLTKHLELSVNSEQRFGTDILAGSFSIALPVFNNQSIGFSIGSYGVEGFRNNQLSLGYARPLSDQLSIGLQLNVHDLRIDLLEQKWSSSANLGVNYQANENTRLMLGVSQLFSSREINPSAFLAIQHRLSTRLMVIGELSYNENKAISLSGGSSFALNDILKLFLSIKTTSERYGYGVEINFIPEVELLLGANHHPILGESFGISAFYSRK